MTNVAHDHYIAYEDVQERKLDVIKKVNSLTKSCSKKYFNSILIKLSNENIENANTICDYIMAEETEINIKNSTKEGRSLV